ncbi:hypothetical protein KDJ56_19985 [Brevibacillus composti]|uniref:Flagellar hook-length control protein FliK n=1 Tax=Brevibacillus composti TaxID=2796470 RepID=A0A7T5JNK3_9BACL|nr:hypothetical protein [Brevibacillus composti]QQE74100.1 hypothetical protein JD108_20050 [Brevibacillus composti]QUO41184.1 hypothetical protein KDJ56_19985 [Brevibacillus composti]
MRVNLPASIHPSQSGIGTQSAEGPGDLPQARASVSASAGGAQSQPDADSVLRGLGIEPTLEMKQSAKVLLDSGVSLSKQAAQDLKEFMGKAPGSLQQKLETIQAIADKKIEVTSGHLRAVHEALHGQPLTGALSDLAQAAGDGLESLDSSANKLMGKGSDLEKTMQSIRERIAGHARISPQLAEKIGKVLYEAAILQQAGKEGEARLLLANLLQQLSAMEGSNPATIGLPPLGELAGPNGKGMAPADGAELRLLASELKIKVQQGAPLEQLLSEFRESLQRLPQPHQETASRVTQALQQAVSLHQAGLEQAGRELVLRMIDQVAADGGAEPAAPAEMSQAATPSPFAYEDQAGLDLASFLTSKDLVVTTFTQRLNEAAVQFQTAKREIVRNIDHVIQVAEANRSQAQAAVKPLLESTIDLLDKAILKSDMMMLTDMETEKELIKASTDLAEAKRLLSRGEQAQALSVLREVKAKLDALNFRPSDTRMMHFATGQSLFSDKVPQAAHLFAQVAETAQHFQNHPPSARNTFEWIRTLGLNYESDLADSHANQHQRGREDHPHNLKTALLQLSKAGEMSTAKSHPAVEQALQNLTGQQLLSKPEAGNQPQSMFFQLPLLLENGLENVKMYVNSKNEGQKVDWENCSLYFLIETKKMGQTGIHINAVDRNLSITLKNDQPTFKEKVESLVASCKENLAEIGYNVVGVNFTRFTEPKKDERQAGPNRPSPAIPASANEAGAAAKGFDLKV